MVRSGPFPNSGLDTKSFGLLAPRAGLEPATLRLTAECSTIELPRNMGNTAGTKSSAETSIYNIARKSASTQREATAAQHRGNLVLESISPNLQATATRSHNGTGTAHSRALAVMGTAVKLTTGIDGTHQEERKLSRFLFFFGFIRRLIYPAFDGVFEFLDTLS